MRDADVRQALVADLARRPVQQRLLVPEVDVRWPVPARVDVLMIGRRICGFEIKSDVDSLRRLPRQVEAFGHVLEEATLVVAARHLTAATAQIPEWWGLWSAVSYDGGIKLRHIRKRLPNPDVDAMAVSAFINRRNLVIALERHGHSGLSRLGVDELRTQLIDTIGPRRTIILARSTMLARKDWQRRSLLLPSANNP